MIWRGELAGYTGTLILEEVDEDEHVARYRFQGFRDGATATATITASPAGWHAEVHQGHGSDLTAEPLAAAAREALGGEAPMGGEVAAGGEAPVGIEAAAAVRTARDPAARRRRALVAAGATAALAAWALRGRR